MNIIDRIQGIRGSLINTAEEMMQGTHAGSRVEHLFITLMSDVYCLLRIMRIYRYNNHSTLSSFDQSISDNTVWNSLDQLSMDLRDSSSFQARVDAIERHSSAITSLDEYITSLIKELNRADKW